ncbi:hypothetical protein BC936DRAFT_149322 [Jimgerdemannia flammicorona]|uniref:Uncharacterized protein n=1 Tax=Jimgerdemannia flammicorona TaxID=994334 RepID=A0A433D121_9FUNG|nr:hypothetical protein BC936DRAFT_149322 [Jimgerdemannia flammicorona]
MDPLSRDRDDRDRRGIEDRARDFFDRDRKGSNDRTRGLADDRIRKGSDDRARVLGDARIRKGSDTSARDRDDRSRKGSDGSVRDRDDQSRKGSEDRSRSPAFTNPGSPPMPSRSPLRNNSRDTNSPTSQMNPSTNQNTYIEPVTGIIGASSVSPVSSGHPSLDLSIPLPDRKRTSFENPRNYTPNDPSPLREPFSPATPKSNNSTGNRTGYFDQAPSTPKSTVSDETRSRSTATAPTTHPSSNILANELIGTMPQLPARSGSPAPSSPLQSPITPHTTGGGVSGWGGGAGEGGAAAERSRVSEDINGMMAMLVNGVHEDPAAVLAPVMQRMSGGYVGMMDSMDELFLQLLISQAVIDAKEFEVLTLEEVEDLKKDHINLTTRVANLTTRLSLESKIREAAHSLTRLHATNKKLAKQANEQLATANRKVDQVATELWKLTQRGSEVQKRLLQHMAGALALGVRKLEEEKGRWTAMSPRQLSLHPADSDAAASMKTSDQEEIIAQLESQLSAMQQTVHEQQSGMASRDREIEALRTQLKSHTMDDTTEAQLEEKEREILELRSELEQVSTRLDFVVRKQQNNGATSDEGEDKGLSSSEAERNATSTNPSSHNTATMAQLSGTLSALEEQLSEYQAKIHKLEHELETTQEASKREKERRGSEPDSQNIRNVLQNSLRDALLEKERMRVQVEQERRRNEDLERKAAELEEELRQAAELRALDGKQGEAEEAKKLQDEIDRLERAKRESAEQLEKRLREAVQDVDQLNAQYEDVVGILRKVFGELPDVAADARNKDIVSTRDESSRKEGRRFSMDAFVGRVQFLSTENQRLVDKILEMQGRLENMRMREEELESASKTSKKELETAWANLESVKATLFELELKGKTSSSELMASTDREQVLQTDLERARDELSALKQEKFKWEQTMKRQSVLQVVQDGGASLKSALEQQLAAQEQDYQAQLKERDVLLGKLQKDAESYKTENAKLGAMCKELEDMVREKIRSLDGRDAVISRLEDDIAKLQAQVSEAEMSMTTALQNASRNGSAASGKELASVRGELAQAKAELEQLLEERDSFEGELRHAQEAVQTMHANLQSAQAQFTERETALEKQSVTLQNEFDGILKEFDRLTRNFVDFESERQRYEGQIDTLHKRCQALETELADERIKHMGTSNPEEVASTATLRKEFRKLMSELRTEQQKVLNREVEEKKKMELLVRDMKREREMVRWEKVNKGVQTGFVAVGV